MSAVIAVMGEGLLADFVSDRLSADYELVRRKDFEQGVPEAADFVLVLHDAWHPSVHLQAEELFQSNGTPWLRGFVAFGEAIIGPWVQPGMPGCSQCADRRLLMAGRERKDMWRLKQRLSERGGAERDAWASRTGLWQAAHLVLAETRNILSGEIPQTADKLQILNLSSMNSELHVFVPDSLCRFCSRMSDDTMQAANIPLRPSPKISADSYRCRSADELKQVLARDYLDVRTGIFNGKMSDMSSSFADASVNLPLFSEDVGTAGRTHSFAASELTAMLEGLERYSSLEPRSKRTAVYGSYREVEAYALDPVKVGVHSKEQYAMPGYRYQPFDASEPIHWVWGYSFLQERPLLVPEQLAYYGTGAKRRFAFESSNGCALGGSLEEAVLYGILETAERDAFLMTWYARLPLPRLDPPTAGDPELTLMLDRLRAAAGYDVHFYNSTMEYGIPSIWAVAVNRKPKGAKLICAAGAHPDPVRAAKGAVHELSGMVSNLDHSYEANKQKAEAMFHDSANVRQMEDHALLYGLPSAQERLRFILDESRPMRSFAESFEQKERHADLTDDLKDMLLRFKRHNLDVIAVDLTAPELARNGLHCVKVLIPGMLPMTFGHHYTRLFGLERVRTVPVALGYAERPLTYEELNPFPHPFP